MRVVVVLLVLVALAGCGSDERVLAPPPEDVAASKALVTDGTPVPEVLSGFSCSADDEGSWAAAGVVTNPTEEPASYQVSVTVGPGDGETTATTTTVEDVKPEKKADFVLTDVATTSPDGPCRVQVLALP